MAYVDPWGPTLEAMGGFESSLRNYANMKRQAELDAMAKQDWELKHAAALQDWRDKQSLRAVAQQMQGTKPESYQTTVGAKEVPDYGNKDYLAAHTPEALAAAEQAPSEGISNLEHLAGVKYSKTLADLATAEGLPPTKYVPITETRTRQVPYTAQEQSNAFIKELLRQGRTDEALKAGGGVLKLQELIPAHDANMNKMALTYMNNALGMSGGDPEAAKAATAKWMRANGFDEKDVQVFEAGKFGPGGVFITPLPGGYTVINKLDAKGEYEGTIEKPVAPVAKEFMGNVVTRKLGGETEEVYPIFHTQEDLARYKAAGSPIDRAAEFGAKGIKKLNENAPRIGVTVANQNYRPERRLPPGWVIGSKDGFLYKEDIDANGKRTLRAPTEAERSSLGDMALDYKFNMDIPREKQVAMIAAVKPRIQTLAKQFENLNNTNVKVVNEAKFWLKDQFGWDDTAAFSTNANTAVLELTRALQGTGAMSDSRVKMELQNLDKSSSPKQFVARISNVMSALDSYEKAFARRAVGPKETPPAGNTKQVGKYKVSW